MTQIPVEHPRYESLITRERIVEGVQIGITSKEGIYYSCYLKSFRTRQG